MDSDTVGYIRVKNLAFGDPWKDIGDGVPFEEVFPIKYSLTKEESDLLRMLHFFYPRHHPIAYWIFLTLKGLLCASALLSLSFFLTWRFFGPDNFSLLWLFALIPIFFVGLFIPLLILMTFDWFVIRCRIIKIMKYVNDLTKITGKGKKYYREMIQDLKNSPNPPIEIDIFTKSILFRFL